jgi:hypothetical protein
MNLVALAKRPAESALAQGVDINFVCESINCGHIGIMRRRRLRRQNEICRLIHKLANYLIADSSGGDETAPRRP